MRYDYQNKNSRSFSDKKPDAGHHPVWRGIGFLIMLITPVISFGLSEIVLNYLKSNVSGFKLPQELRTGPIEITSSWVVVDLWALLVITGFLIFFLLAFFVLINTAIFSVTKNKNKDIFEADKKKFRKTKRNFKR